MTNNENAVALNFDRANDAGAAMTAFVKTKEPTARDLESIRGQSLQEYMIDLLADFRHWARENDLDFEDADRIAADHFEAEVEAEEADDAEPEDEP